MSLHDLGARLSPIPIPAYVARSISWLLAIHAVVTGWDYLHTPEAATTSRTLTMVEQLATLHTWGVLFLVAGLTLFAGLALRRHFAVWVGHALCTVFYVGFTVATFQAVWEVAGTPVWETQGSLWRGVTQSLIVTALHGFLCYVRGSVPKIGDEQ